MKDRSPRVSKRSSRQRAGVLLSAFSAVLVPVTALAGSFAVLSYNVRGLPPQVIENREEEMQLIAPKLEDFHTSAPPYEGISSVVGLQELFYAPYYNTLTDPEVVSYPFITVKDNSGIGDLGDGLTMLSDFTLNNFSRIEWEDCHGTLGEDGSDCDANKGFSFARVQLEPNVSVDVYTLHADAGQDEASRSARRKNILQLMDAINLMSPPGSAVIVLGDTNSKYTRVGNDNLQSLLFGTGITDVWVQLRRASVVPESGPDIDSGCAVDPAGADCELVDKIFYRDGASLVLAPQSYNVLDAMFSDEEGNPLSDHLPVAVTFDYAVVTTTTTTTSTSSTSTSTSTSTTLEFERPCGDPVALVYKRQIKRAVRELGEDRAVVASDALFVLKAAVGSLECPLCTCDVDNSTKVTATDALRVLKVAVGQSLPLTCPACL